MQTHKITLPSDSGEYFATNLTAVWVPQLCYSRPNVVAHLRFVPEAIRPLLVAGVTIESFFCRTPFRTGKGSTTSIRPCLSMPANIVEEMEELNRTPFGLVRRAKCRKVKKRWVLTGNRRCYNRRCRRHRFRTFSEQEAANDSSPFQYPFRATGRSVPLRWQSRAHVRLRADRI